MAADAIGILAGYGQFPALAADGAKNMGRPVFVSAMLNQADPGLEAMVDGFEWVKTGQIQKSIDFFKANNVGRMIMAGGIERDRMLEAFEPDDRAWAILGRIDPWSDDVFLRALAAEFESEGVEVLDPVDFTPQLLAPEGVLTAKAPDDGQATDIEYGWQVAKKLGEVDVGQCVVVWNKMVLAVEALEGSDKTIARGASFAKDKAVVVKVFKPGQDRRFDRPSVGTGTIAVMAEAGAAVLAVEAGAALMFDREAMIEAADRAGIVVIARKGD